MILRLKSHSGSLPLLFTNAQDYKGLEIVNPFRQNDINENSIPRLFRLEEPLLLPSLKNDC